MNQLDEYLLGNYKQDKAETAKIDEELDEIFKVFIETYDSDSLVEIEHRPQWPYVLKANQKPQPNYSSSTTSMILYALKEYLEHRKDYVKEKDLDQMKKMIGKVEEKLFSVKPSIENKNVKKGRTKKFIIWPEAFPKLNNFLLSTSATYGLNDPLTLFWMASIANKSENANSKNFIQNKFEKIFFEKDIANTSAIKIVNAKSNIAVEKETIYGSKRVLDYQKKLVLHDNAFVYLVGLRLLEISNKRYEYKKKNIFNILENKLHKHISFYNIPDSRFDPAEMIFSLEGMLIVEFHKVSEGLIRRVFEILQLSQQKLTAFWKPVTPIYAKDTGHVLLPLGIEVLNSLLRVCQQLDGKINSTGSYFSENISLFKRYIKWLNAQKVSVEFGDKKYVGWNSEHIAKDNEIHLWQTSQIFHFLFEYNQLLKKHIARETLLRAGLKLKKDHIFRSKEERMKDWNSVVAGEPVAGEWGDPEAKVYKVVDDHYVKPRIGNEDCQKDCSFLLYGPHGTGKSRLGEEIAKALNWPFLSITPSDFLAGGAAEVEHRAKSIFTMLNEQHNLVVLLDEIDHFLLNRESEEYKNQTGIFQFMTPGMLPKLQDLRDQGQIIFIVATNYAERIDPAIKRSGRIDRHLLLLPPDKQARQRIIKQELIEAVADVLNEKNENLDIINIQDCLDNCALMTWGEIVKKCRALEISSADLSYDDLSRIEINKKVLDKLNELFKDSKASISLEAYEPRVYKDKRKKKNLKDSTDQIPWREYLHLHYIRNEDVTTGIDTSFCEDIKKRIEDEGQPTWFNLHRKKGR